MFWNVYIRLLFLNNLTNQNYVSGKIEWHVPPQSTAAKNGGGRAPRLSGAPMIKPPQISKANFAYGRVSLRAYRDKKSTTLNKSAYTSTVAKMTINPQEFKNFNTIKE